MARIKLMTAKQMMKFLQVSNTTLRKYAEEGRIGVLQPGGKNCAVRYYLLPDEENHGRTETA